MLEQISRQIGDTGKSAAGDLSEKLAKIKRLPLDIAKKSKSVVKGAVDLIIRKPSELSDYIKIGGSYVAKRALLAGILIAAAAVLAIIWFVVPLLRGTNLSPRLVVNTPEFHTASGMSEVYTPEGALLYSGMLKDGRADGYGKLYRGKALIYEGEFSDNEYCGKGRLYDTVGALVYYGEFADSKYNGIGREYYESGGLKLKGTYVSGKLEGKGAMYSEKGVLIYSGEFSSGIYNGKGELYENGRLVYRGDFVNGWKTGEGTLYKNGRMVYSGGFLEGAYSGNGVLYNFKNGMRLEGTFENGLANGNASLYSSEGELLYCGAVSDGEIAYLSYAAADRQQTEQCFTENAVVKELGDKFIVHYRQLGAGFIFGADGKTDRIIITGDQQLLNAETGKLKNEFLAPDGALKYSEYDFVPEEFDIMQLSYSGIKPPEQMNVTKYIRDSTFLKLYFSEGRLLFYEIGIV